MRIMILFILAISSLSFSVGKDFGEANRDTSQEKVVVTSSTIPSVYVGNPFIIEDLSADMHDSETYVPAYADLPVGITFENTTTTEPSYVSYEPEVALKSTSSVVVTTTSVVLPSGRCSEWYGVALEAGWPEDSLNKLGNVIFKESSCIADIANKTYSYGLTQIEWSAHEGWLASEFGITEREELYDPYVNLLVAKWLFDYAERNYGCGWQPWYMSGDWC